MINRIIKCGGATRMEFVINISITKNSKLIFLLRVGDWIILDSCAGCGRIIFSNISISKIRNEYYLAGRGLPAG